MPEVESEVEIQGFHDLAVETIGKERDIEACIALLVPAIMANPEVHDEVIRLAARRMVTNIRDVERRALKYPPLSDYKPGTTTRGIESILTTAPTRMLSLLDSWTVGEKVLGDLCRDDLTTWRDDTAERSNGFKAVSEFAGKLLGVVHGQRTVRQSITNKRATELWKSVCRRTHVSPEVAAA